MNIVKMTNDSDLFNDVDSMDYDVKFWPGGWYDGPKYTDVLETIIVLNKTIRDKEITIYDMLRKYMEHDLKMEERKDIFDEITEYHGTEEFYNDIYELLDDGFPYEILEYLQEDKEFLEKIARLYDCVFGTVGYSPWAYYLAWGDLERSFIRDLYEGWHWYDLTLLDEEGNPIDSVGGCYIPDVNELHSQVEDYFGIEKNDYWLVDNMEATYFDHKKIKELTDINYSYVL